MAMIDHPISNLLHVTKAECVYTPLYVIILATCYFILGPGNCGYPDCPKPRCIDRTPGVVHKFCGQRHATQYRELQTNGTVHDNSHQVPVVTRQASRSEQFVR